MSVPHLKVTECVIQNYSEVNKGNKVHFKLEVIFKHDISYHIDYLKNTVAHKMLMILVTLIAVS